MKTWKALATAALAAASIGACVPAAAVTLDREGKLTTDMRFRCDDDIDFDGAGGYPDFKIDVTGRCAVLNAEGHLPGWSSVDWQPVRYEGTYDYESGQAIESIELLDGTRLVRAVMNCAEGNPWVTGKSCPATEVAPGTTLDELSPHQKPKIDLSFPASALRLEYQTLQTLAQWESEQGQPEPLADWNPITTTDPKLDVASPSWTVSANAASFEFDASRIGPPTLVSDDTLDIEWARIVPAKDPSLSADGKWWETGPSAAPTTTTLGDLPLSIDREASGFVEGEYAVRVKFATGSDATWSDWQRFHVGTPTIQPGLATSIGRLFQQGQQDQADGSSNPDTEMTKSRVRLQRIDSGDAPEAEAPTRVLRKKAPATVAPIQRLETAPDAAPVERLGTTTPRKLKPMLR